MSQVPSFLKEILDLQLSFSDKEREATFIDKKVELILTEFTRLLMPAGNAVLLTVKYSDQKEHDLIVGDYVQWNGNTTEKSKLSLFIKTSVNAWGRVQNPTLEQKLKIINLLPGLVLEICAEYKRKIANLEEQTKKNVISYDEMISKLPDTFKSWINNSK